MTYDTLPHSFAGFYCIMYNLLNINQKRKYHKQKQQLRMLLCQKRS